MGKNLKVCDLEGANLNIAVALALGYERYSGPWWRHREHAEKMIDLKQFSPSTNGQQGHDIIESDWISLERPSRGQKEPTWRAVMDNAAPRIGSQVYQTVVAQFGETALIAAMRAKVASVYGDVISSDLFKQRRAA